MGLAKRWQRWLGQLSTGRRTSHARRPQLALEELEDRSVPSTFTVLNLADSGAGSLRQAILAANAAPGADAVAFASGVRGTLTLTSGELAISDDLTITGPGAPLLTVSGGQASRVFHTSGKQVMISGLTVADGLATGRQALGGGLLNTGGRVVAIGVTFADNTAQGDVGPNPTAGGGAIANIDGATLVLSECQFVSNRAVAAHVAAGGAILNDTGAHLTVEGGTFTGNLAFGAFLKVKDNNFHTNLLASAGGAIATLGDSTAVVRLTVFAGNRAVGGDGLPGNDTGGQAIGGAIEVSGVSLLGNKVGRPSLSVANCRFLDNEAIGGTGAAADRPNKTGGTGGSAFGGTIGVDYGATTTIIDSEFRGNRAVGGPGGSGTGGAAGGEGGAGAAGALSNTNSALTVERCSFRENVALGGIGGSSSTAGGFGGVSKGGVMTQVDFATLPGFRATTTFVDTAMTGNVAAGGAGGNGGAGQGGNTRRARGGALSLNNGTLTVVRCLVDGNVAVGGAGGAGAVQGRGGEARGGGVIVDTVSGGRGVLIVADSVLRNNRAVGGSGGVAGAGLGGGLFVGAETNETVVATVTNTIIANNLAVGGAGTERGGDGLGGGIFVTAGDVVPDLRAVSVTGNRAAGGTGATSGAGVGGGLYTAPGGTTFADLLTLIFANDASTSDDIFGRLTFL